MQRKPYVSAVIVAAGDGTRMGSVSKPLIKIGGKTVIERVAEAFSACPSVDEIIIVCKDPAPFEVLVKSSKPVTFVTGGNIRSESVSNGVDAAKKAEIVCIHDCARPFITPGEIETLITEAEKTGASSACTKVKDTIKYVSEEEKCFYTPKRENLIAVQTPQVFKRDIYLASRAAALKDGLSSTDETTIAEHAGFKVSYVETSEFNIKLTDANDIKIAKAICFLEERDGV
jgi:2-C-methyl-D-erythritol 4-phosphate cytidylyltransferase